MLFIVVIAAVMAILLLPTFVPIVCSTGNRWKCEVYKAAGPYLGVFIALLVGIPYRRFLLGKPVAILTRAGIESGLHSIRWIEWANIEGVEINRLAFSTRMTIRLTADAEPPPRTLLDVIRSDLHGSNARTHLYVSQWHIDRPLAHLKHWIEEGRRNAAASVSPDPFFTVPY